MNDIRRELHAVAAEFANRIYEIVRRGVLEEVNRKLTAQAPRANAPAAQARPMKAPVARASTSDMERVIDFVRAHPGTAPKHIVSELGIRRETVQKLLGEACAAGTFTKVGGAPRVQYFAATSASAPKAASEGRSRTEAACEQVVAWVRAHPGCRLSELQEALNETRGVLSTALATARERGQLRLEGSRGQARYFPREAEALAPRTTPPAPPAPANVTRPEPTRATKLIRELDGVLAEPMPGPRFVGLLRAITAELRGLLEHLPADDAPALERAIARIGAVAAERQLPELIALTRRPRNDWESVARKARAQVAMIEMEAEAEPTGVASDLDVERRADASTFPHLATTRLPIVLVGGIVKRDLLAQVRERYGFDVEWTAAQGSNSRAVDSVIERIRRGRVCAFIVLEGLFGHRHVLPIVAALKAARIPFAYGGRGGTESLRRALADIERRLAPENATAVAV